MALELYHGKTSVCSASVRLALAERGLDWQGHMLDLSKGDQHTPQHLCRNPLGVVPVLVHDGHVITESQIILEYVDAISTGTRLMPSEPALQARARMWLADSARLHGAINTLTFLLLKLPDLFAKKTPKEIDAAFNRHPNPETAAKRRDLVACGVGSAHVTVAFFSLHLVLGRMGQELSRSAWLLGPRYSIAETGMLSYLDRLGLSFFWEGLPAIAHWPKRSRARPSYETAIAAFAGPSDIKPAALAYPEPAGQLRTLWLAYVKDQEGRTHD